MFPTPGPDPLPDYQGAVEFILSDSLLAAKVHVWDAYFDSIEALLGVTPAGRSSIPRATLASTATSIHD